MFTAFADNYRRLINVLNHYKIEYFTYTLQCEKDLNIVIKGIPIGISTKDIAGDLLDKGFDLKFANRMTKGPERSPIVLVCAVVPKKRQILRKFSTSRCQLNHYFNQEPKQDNAFVANGLCISA